jgi:hypothetical protein
MNKNAADKILARINAINTILNSGTRTSLTPEGNDAGDICELNHAQIQAVMFNLDQIVDEVRESDNDDLLEEQESVYWAGLGIH